MGRSRMRRKVGACSTTAAGISTSSGATMRVAFWPRTPGPRLTSRITSAGTIEAICRKTFS